MFSIIFKSTIESKTIPCIFNKKFNENSQQLKITEITIRNNWRRLVLTNSPTKHHSPRQRNLSIPFTRRSRQDVASKFIPVLLISFDVKPCRRAVVSFEGKWKIYRATALINGEKRPVCFADKGNCYCERGNNRYILRRATG